MNHSIIAFVAAGIVTLTSFAAQAKEHKPVLCQSFTEMTMPVDGTPTKVAVCTDRAKPVILTTYQVITAKNEDGVSTRMVLGYR